MASEDENVKPDEVRSAEYINGDLTDLSNLYYRDARTAAVPC